MIELPQDGTFVGRAWRGDVEGPSLVVVRDGVIIDITSPEALTMRDLLEMSDPVGHARQARGEAIGSVEEIAAQSLQDNGSGDRLLAPFDLQAIKACGVTFANSMIERVIEEKAAGDPAKAEAIRKRCFDLIGDSLHDLEAGSPEAGTVKQALIEEGVWSQYLEVGIGPDAEVFTKAQPMSSEGFGARVGLHPVSSWNNPEPEIVLAVDSRGAIRGATLGNDVNLRDVEGRSALLLGKAKDNNASCSIGPFIRLFDDTYGMDNVRNAELELRVEGEDGFVLDGASSMKEISRDPVDLVRQTCGDHHQYPDGFALFLGTLFAPTADRDTPGEGFTHKRGDIVEISSPELGRLTNSVYLSTECPPWIFGTAALMLNLMARGLLRPPENVPA